MYSVSDEAIYNMEHIPLNKPFGEELQDRLPRILSQAGVAMQSKLGTDDDTKWGTDFIFRAEGQSTVRLDLTADFDTKDHMVELDIEPLGVWGEQNELLAEIRFGVRSANEHHTFRQKVLVMGIDTGERRVRYQHELDKLVRAINRESRMLRNCLMEAVGQMALAA